MAWPEKIELSKTQREAVEAVGKNVCLSAGAGSGKTRVLVERFLYLVTHYGVSPTQILAITFTEKAANEMKQRIVRRLREERLEAARREVENAAIGTIHAFCARLLREHPIEARVDPHFVIFEAETATLLKERVLDEVIEREVSGPAVFDLLRIYGERNVREGILRAFQASRNSEVSFDALLRRRSQASRASLGASLKEGLREIEGVNGVAEMKEALEDFFEKKDFSFAEIRSLAELKLTASGKQKEAIKQVKGMLADLVSFLYEEKGLPVREVFIRLALQFEKGYEEAKRLERALDFDDLQLRAVQLLSSGAPPSERLRKIYQEKFREIMVDEFQDTNRLQDRLLELIRRESNLFIVGDFKQSIYAFRGTKMEIFLEKEKVFAATPEGCRFSLVRNYRARPKLIDFVNRFFERLWEEDGVPFERLEAFRKEEGEGARVEWLALEKKERESADEVRIREARTLAGQIRSLVDEEGFHFKEIAYLFEAMTNVYFYEQELRRAEIPYYVVSNRGFYAQPEIRDVVSFLVTLENPRQDVPLAALLRSPLFQVSDDTLFWLSREAKKKTKQAPFFGGLQGFESIPEIPEREKEKLRFFKEVFESFLKEKEKMRISELIEDVLRVTHYDLYVLKLRQGERRYANLRKLVEIAREMEAKESLHLGDFVRAVKGLEMREIRESQAQVEAEEGDVVRLMSIHMAKGLEFPVVVLPDLGRFEKTEGGPFSVLEEEGWGMKVWDPEGFDFEETFMRRRVRERQDRRSSEESKRKLYVAMTRAEEKLILAGPRSTAKQEKASFHEMATWADWMNRILSEGDWEIQLLSEAAAEPFPFERRKALAERKSLRSRLEGLRAIRLREIPPEVDQVLENLVSPEPEYFQRIDLPVSAFLLFTRDPEEYFRVYEMGVPGDGPLPRSLEVKEEEPDEAETLTSAAFGTRVHQILEVSLLHRAKGSALEGIVSRFTQDLSERQRNEIHDLTRQFFQSEEAQEVLRAKTFYPELPFVLRLPQGLVHGTLDLLYQNLKGEWVVLDYKTSQVDEKSFRERGEDYRVQLELYALAVSEILGCPPAEACIHFLRAGLTHRIGFAPTDAEKWFEKFTALQKEILSFRKERLEPYKYFS